MTGHSPDCFCYECRGDFDGCMGSMVCPRCGRFHGYCSEVGKTNHNTGENTMDLKGHLPTDRGGKKGGKGFTKRPFMRVKDIPAKGAKAKVIDFREAPNGMPYSDFLVDVSMGKKEYTLGLRSGSVLLSMLCDVLGTKTEKWTGKTVTLIHGGPKGQYINAE